LNPLFSSSPIEQQKLVLKKIIKCKRGVGWVHGMHSTTPFNL